MIGYKLGPWHLTSDQICCDSPCCVLAVLACRGYVCLCSSSPLAEAGAPALSKTRNRGLRHRKKVLDTQAVCSYKKEACLRHQTNVLDADGESKTSSMGLRHRINNGSRARGLSRVPHGNKAWQLLSFRFWIIGMTHRFRGNTSDLRIEI